MFWSEQCASRARPDAGPGDPSEKSEAAHLEPTAVTWPDTDSEYGDRGSNSGTRLCTEFFLENFLCGGGSQKISPLGGGNLGPASAQSPYPGQSLGAPGAPALRPAAPQGAPLDAPETRAPANQDMGRDGWGKRGDGGRLDPRPRCSWPCQCLGLM